MTTDARLARWTAPLPAPCADPRAHATYELVRAELAKLESPTGGAVDWAEVLRAGDTFLGEVGRDLMVAGPVATALAHREGAAGLTVGARLLTALLADPATAPPRTRARSSAIEAFATRAELALDTAKDRTRGTLELLGAACADLDDAASRALGSDAPSLRGIRERVAGALATLPAPAPLPTPSPSPSPPPPPPPASVFAPPPPLPPPALPPQPAPSVDALPDRVEQVPSFVRRLAGQLVPAAALARSASVLDADALRWTLVALYLPITTAPETTRDARTALPAPPKLVLEQLDKQSATAAPEAIVRDALAALERSRFALDLHAHLSRALDRAGAGAARAREIHRHEVEGLLARLPELLDREFSDGTPFASPSTRAHFASWGTAVPSPPSGSGDDPVARLREAAQGGRTADAIAIGTAERRSAGAGRARFALTLAMAEVAHDARATALAVELASTLVDDVDRHALDAWDPALATEALRLAARILGAPPGGALFTRVARVDPRAALDLAALAAPTPPTSTSHATPARSGR